MYEKVTYNAEYNKRNYSEFKIRVRKGEKEIIENYRKKKGYESLNAYINALIKKDMEEELGGGNLEND